MECYRVRCVTVERNWEHDFHYSDYKVTRSKTQQNVLIDKKESTVQARSYNTSQIRVPYEVMNILAIHSITSLVI
jgi:hypothetical protein